MDNRRVQRTGGASLTMTLPKQWVTTNQLAHHDIVNTTIQKNGSLLIKADKVENIPWQAILSLKQLTNTMLIREVVALYLAGADEIEFQGKSISSQQRSTIRTVAQTLLGFEIIDESATKILLKNLFDTRKLPLTETVAKIFHITDLMFADALQVIVGHNKRLAQDIIDRDIEIDKLHLMLKRQFYSVLQDKISEEELGMDRLMLGYYESVTIQLERIADHAVKIAYTLSQENKKQRNTRPRSHESIAHLLFELLKQSAEMVATVDKQKAHHILNSNEALEKLFKRTRNRMKHSLPTDVIITDSLDRLRGYIMNMAELTIDQATVQHIQKIRLTGEG